MTPAVEKHLATLGATDARQDVKRLHFRVPHFPLVHHTVSDPNRRRRCRRRWCRRAVCRDRLDRSSRQNRHGVANIYGARLMASFARLNVLGDSDSPVRALIALSISLSGG